MTDNVPNVPSSDASDAKRWPDYFDLLAWNLSRLIDDLAQRHVDDYVSGQVNCSPDDRDDSRPMSLGMVLEQLESINDETPHDELEKIHVDLYKRYSGFRDQFEPIDARD